VVTLYEGGLYHLYRYKKYTDVRLVFAPSSRSPSLAAIRTTSNTRDMTSTYACSGRMRTASPPGSSTLSSGARRAQRTMSWCSCQVIRGGPAGSSRWPSWSTCVTSACPFLTRLKDQEVLLSAYSARSEENARRAKDDLFGVQNSRKAYDGMYAGCLDPRLLARKREAEQGLRAAVTSRADLSDAADAWDRIAAAQKVIAGSDLRYNLLEGGHGLQQRSVCHCPYPAQGGRRASQAQCRPPPRVRRGGTRIPRVSALLREANLR